MVRSHPPLCLREHAREKHTVYWCGSLATWIWYPLDTKVPDYVWTEVIAQDICMFQIGAPSGTFVVELLSDTEFLLFQGPWSGPGIA